MPSFDSDQELRSANQIDWSLLKNGYVTKFCSTDVLENTVTWLRETGYEIVEMETSKWTSESDVHLDFADAFSFPSYYGRNLSALADCLGEVARYAYGSNRDSAGTVLVLSNYDKFLHRNRGLAEAILDVFANSARVAALIGHRMICLAQSNERTIEIPPVGATPSRGIP
jgi:barstar (barnase inhibitor)